MVSMAMAIAAAAPMAMGKGPSTFAAPKKKLSAKELSRTIIRRKPMEQIYAIRVERGAGEERLGQLGVAGWSRWRSGECSYLWDWIVDEWVYICSGSLLVRPVNSDLSGEYFAGDLVRFPKWFDAHLFFKGEYEQRYRFVAYGDTELD